MCRVIHLNPLGGLCNRLRAISSSLHYVQRFGGNLSVWWLQKYPGMVPMNVRYSDIFEVRSDFLPFRMHEDLMSCLMGRFLFSKKNPKHLTWEKAPNLMSSLKTTEKENIWLSEHRDFYPSHDYSFARPKRAIQAEIDAVKSILGDAAIGVHIRRTDNEQSVKCSPLSMFIASMERALDQDPRQKFFLATDDPQVKVMMVERFGSQVYTRSNVATRASHSGVHDAVVDLFSLAACHRGILGSYWSSFSLVAADIGRVPLSIIKKEQGVANG